MDYLIIDEDGESTKMPEEIALHMLESVAAEGHPHGMYLLGLARMSGAGAQDNKNAGRDMIIRAAQAGDADAQYLLAIPFNDKSLDLERRIDAAQWMEKAANSGDCRAQLGMGLICLDGTLVGGVDKVKAFRWFEASALQGLAAGQFMHGMCLLEGEGAQKDTHAGSKWIIKSAEQGLEEAQFQLGKMYENGLGVVRSRSNARLWYQRAARSGNTAAMAAYLDLHP